MSELNPRLSNLANVIYDMEDDVRRVERWAQVLMVMSASCHCVQPEALGPIADALHDLVEAFNEQYDRAYALAHPQAEQPGGKPCA